MSKRAALGVRAKFQTRGQTGLFERLARALDLHETKQIRAALGQPTVRVTVQNWRAGRHCAPAWAIDALKEKARERARELQDLVEEIRRIAA